jgi:hypothetical protein
MRLMAGVWEISGVGKLCLHENNLNMNIIKYISQINNRYRRGDNLIKIKLLTKNRFSMIPSQTSPYFFG